MKKSLAALVTSMALGAPVLAQDAPNAVDFNAIDIAGLRLGMGYQETIETIAGHFGMTVEAVDAKAGKLDNQLLDQKLAQWLSITQGPETISVNFATRIPLDPNNPLVVDVVTYKLPWTPENEASMAQAALEKYGQNSNAPETYARQWCSNPAPNTMDVCPLSEARLTLVSTELQMTDNAYDRAVQDFLNEPKTVQPKF